MEWLESRDLPSAGVFLQGTAFVDLGHDHTLSQKDPYLPGAAVALYQGTTTSGTPLATIVTNAQGAYLFDDANVAVSYGQPGLNPGVYSLVETPPSGYAVTGTGILSQVDPAVAVDANTIQVTALDPTNLALAFDVNQFFGRNAWDYLQQSLQYSNSGVTNGSPLVTMSNTAGMAVGDGVTVQQGSTTLNTTIAAIAPNASITLAQNWTGTTGNAATVTDTENEAAGQFPVQLVDPDRFTQTFDNAGMTHDSYSVKMTDTSGFAVDQFVKVSDGTTTLYSLITDISKNSSITLADQWGGATGNTATVSALSDFDLSFLSLCVDLSNAIDDSFSPPVSVTNVFQAAPMSGQGALPNAGRIAYLFNHYGTVDITNSAADAAALAGANATVPSLAQGTIAEAVGLQAALWELEYGTSFDDLQVLSRLSSKNPAVLAQELSDVNTWAAFYVADSAGKSETATFLQANGIVQLGQQGMVAGGSYDFGNAGSPSITTSPNVTSVTLSNTEPTVLTDSATLSGGYNPTGTITFTLYHDGGSTPVDTETVAVEGDGIYTTPWGYTLPNSGTVTGTYQWDASYSGDANNQSVSDVDDPNEQVTVVAASPSIIATPSTEAVTLGTSSVTLNDTAALSGGYHETGTITFTLYLGDTLVDTETAAVDGDGTYSTSSGYTLPASGMVTGTYQWNVSYNGDGNNLSAGDVGDPAEQVVVNPANPSITSTPSTTSVTLGTSEVTLSDTATLSGGYSPNGTITFTLYYDGNLVDTESTGVSGNGSYSTPTGYTLPASGTVTGIYQWDVSYSGDSNNNSADDLNDPGEQIAVSSASPGITTTPSATRVTLGTSAVTLTDSAQLSGGYSPTGTITFTLYLGDTLVDTEAVAVDGDGSYTTPTGYTLPTSGTVTGTYQWDASYSGDDNDQSASDCNDEREQVVVSPASPLITTTPSTTSVTLGTTSVTLNDTAVLYGGYNETGTITFTLYYDGGNTPVDTEMVPVEGDGIYTAPSGYTLPSTGSATGTYQWDASYAGDSNNNSTSDLNDPDEQVTVSPATPTITSLPSSSVVLGTAPVTLSDTALLAGGYAETGTITFTLYYNGGSSPVDTETVSVQGDGSYRTPTGYTLPNSGTVTGTYQWDASYSGDANNQSVSDVDDPNEQVTVAAASPSIIATPSTEAVTLGTSSVTLNDTAVLSGGYHETGTITFTLYSGDVLVDTETAAVDGDGSYSTPSGYTLPTSGAAAGTYQWNVSYSGDGNNESAGDVGDPAEQVVVNPANPSITSAPGANSVTLGTSTVTLSDTATLSGGYSPSGTITFTLYYDGNLVDTESAGVNGNGSYSTPTGYTLPASGTVTGTYQWDASYSGDANNVAVSDNNAANEQVTVSPASPSITTTPNTTSVTLGTSVVTLTDTALLSGAYSPIGTITFTLDHDSTVVDTEEVAVSGDGSYTTPAGYTLPISSTVAGTYQWNASYSGDGNNESASDTNDPAEQVVVNAEIPVAQDDTYAVSENGVLIENAAGGVLANDSIPNGDPLVAKIVTATAHGSLRLDGDGSFVYVPEPGFYGSDSFTYVAEDSLTGISSPISATVTIDVSPASALVDTNPRLVPLTIEAADLLARDSSTEGDALSIVPDSIPATTTQGGTLVYNSVTGTIEYTAPPTFLGTDSFTYAVQDSSTPALSGLATVFIDVQEPAPVPSDLSPGGTVLAGGTSANPLALGVDAFGDLNYTNPETNAIAGLLLDGQDGIDPAGSVPYEGWGVAAFSALNEAASAVGYVDRGADGAVNLIPISFTPPSAGNPSATSVVDLVVSGQAVLQVTQVFTPVAGGDYYTDSVTIGNLSSTDFQDLEYRQVVDFPGAQAVVLDSGTTPALDMTRDGIASANPLAGDASTTPSQGALFDFDLGALAAAGTAGSKLNFTVYFGAAGDQMSAQSAVIDPHGINSEAYAVTAPSGEGPSYFVAFTGLGGFPISTISGAIVEVDVPLITPGSPPDKVQMPGNEVWLEFTQNSSPDLGVRLANYSTNPTPATLQLNGVTIESSTFVDVHVEGANSSDFAVLSFALPADSGLLHYTGPAPAGTVVTWWDAATQQWFQVLGDTHAPENNYIVNGRLQFIIDPASVPAITGLDGTVFAINIVVPQTSTVPVSPPVAAGPSFNVDVATAVRLTTSSQITFTLQSAQSSQSAAAEAASATAPAAAASGAAGAAGAGGGGQLTDQNLLDLLDQNPDLFWLWLQNMGPQSKPKAQDEVIDSLLPSLRPELPQQTDDIVFSPMGQVSVDDQQVIAGEPASDPVHVPQQRPGAATQQDAVQQLDAPGSDAPSSLPASTLCWLAATQAWIKSTGPSRRRRPRFRIFSADSQDPSL